MKHEKHHQRKSEQDPINTGYYITSKIIDWSLAKKNNLWHPPTDVYETAEQFIVTIEIAGMNERNIEILFENSRLSVRGKRNIRIECAAFHQIEIDCGEFLSTVGFTTPINEDEIKTKYLDGLLLISLKKLLHEK